MYLYLVLFWVLTNPKIGPITRSCDDHVSEKTICSGIGITKPKNWCNNQKQEHVTIMFQKNCSVSIVLPQIFVRAQKNCVGLSSCEKL